MTQLPPDLAEAAHEDTTLSCSCSIATGFDKVGKSREEAFKESGINSDCWIQPHKLEMGISWPWGPTLPMRAAARQHTFMALHLMTTANSRLT